MKAKIKKSFLKKVLVSSICLTTLFVAVSCSNESYSDTNWETETKNGSAKVSMFVPDYANLSSERNARVVAPQTESVKFGYKTDDTFVYLESVSLGDAEKTSVSEEASKIGISGYIYKLTFDGIPCGIYKEGTMEVILQDSEGNAISKGSNEKSVEVSEDKSANASFFTIPVNSDSESGSLKSGEMKFLKVSVDSGSKCEISVSSEDSDSLPDLIVFSSEGQFKKYANISAKNTSIFLESSENDAKYFIGVWANGKEISSYKLNIESKTSTEEKTESGSTEKSEETKETENSGGDKTGSVEVNIDDDTKTSSDKNESKSTQDKTERTKDVSTEEKPLTTKSVVQGTYEMSCAGGFEKQKANSDFQIVNNIAVSALINEEYVSLKMDSKGQYGIVQFTLDKPMSLYINDIQTEGKQKHGIIIVSSDGKATIGDEKVSLNSFDELPKTKRDAFIVSEKTVMLTSGTYKLGSGYSNIISKLAKLTFSETE